LARQSYLRFGDRETWAEITNALAEAYVQVYKGEKGITKAINLTKAALKVFTRDKYPEEHQIYSDFVADLKSELRFSHPKHKKWSPIRARVNR